MRALILITVLLLIAGAAAAQEGEITPTPQPAPDTGVWVTTQDFVSFRAGPGQAFQRYRVIDPAVTMPAIGRDTRGSWIQVQYEGQNGWIYSELLVWSGDIVQLPIDGIDPEPFVRIYRNQVFVPAGTPLYYRQVTPEDLCCYAPEDDTVEITAHLGDGYYYWVQINYRGTLYWTGSWALGIVRLGQDTFNTAYMYGYSRAADQLEADIESTYRRLNEINSIWVRLSVGESVSCGVIPSYVQSSRALDAELASEPVFAPLVRSLRSAIDRVNRAISLFADACSRPADQFFITQTEVVTAFQEIDSAGRDLVLVSSLIAPLRRRDPVNEILSGSNP